MLYVVLKIIDWIPFSTRVFDIWDKAYEYKESISTEWTRVFVISIEKNSNGYRDEQLPF